MEKGKQKMKKQILNYENYYIYDNGDVENINTKKFLKGSIGEHGYKYYRLSKNNTKKMFYAHRLVAEAFIDNPENLPIVNPIPSAIIVKSAIVESVITFCVNGTQSSKEKS